MSNQQQIKLAWDGAIQGFADEDGVQYDCAVEVGAWCVQTTWNELDGRSEVMTLKFSRLDGRPITGTGVRMLPLGEVIAESRRLVSDHAERTRGDLHNPSLQDEWTESKRVANQLWHRITPEHAPLLEAFVATGPRRGKPLTDVELQHVADVYKAAYRDPDRPSVQRAVADAFFIAPSTATKRIMLARKKGLLEGIGPR